MSEARFTHLNDDGDARMVDVSGKDVTVRSATARGRVTVSTEVVGMLRGAGVPKGDALAVARIAGIQAAKRTPDLIPLCHRSPFMALTSASNSVTTTSRSPQPCAPLIAPVSRWKH
jgi:molybdenum cofactor biosynthesis protein MoaC